MNKTINLILKGISNTIVTVVIVILFLLVGLKIFGFQIYTVLSGSMEPTYKVGSVIYVKEVDTDKLKVKDPITFKISENTIATHRIIDIVEDEDGVFKFQTQGDANENPDEGLVPKENVLGKPVFTIPYLGYFAVFIQSPAGLCITLGIGLVLTIVVILLEDVTKDPSKEKKKSKKENKNKEKESEKEDE